MKLAFFSPSRCPDTLNGSGGHHGPHSGLYGAFLRQLKTAWIKYRIQKEMDSFFRVAESMGLNPMKNQHPPFQLRKLETVKQLMTTLCGINFPLQPAQNQQQP